MESLDQQIERLQNIDPFNVHGISENGQVAPWYEVNGTIIQDLVIREEDLTTQVQAVSAQIAHWGRHVARCQRVQEIAERVYRSWRSRFTVDVMKWPDGEDKKPGWTTTAKGEPKPPTKEVVDALYRAADDYVIYQTEIERAKEAWESSKGIVEGFKAKRDMLRLAVRRNQDGSVSLTV